jgi:hypothetical protein
MKVPTNKGKHKPGLESSPVALTLSVLPLPLPPNLLVPLQWAQV